MIITVRKNEYSDGQIDKEAEVSVEGSLEELTKAADSIHEANKFLQQLLGDGAPTVTDLIRKWFPW